MYCNAADHPLTHALEEHAAEFLAEVLAVPARSWEPVADDLVVSGRWAALGLLDALDPARAARWRHNAASCPRSTAILQRISGLHVGGFLLMTPGTRLRPHADVQDPRFFNFTLALTGGGAAWMRVGAERRRHEDGRCVVFDPRIEHEAGNEGPVDRLALYAAVGIHAVRLPLAGGTAARGV